MIGLLSSMELDHHGAATLFDLLDFDGSGQVNLAEFVVGCMRLRGQARAVEVARTHADVSKIGLAVDSIKRHILTIESKEDEILGTGDQPVQKSRRKILVVSGFMFSMRSKQGKFRNDRKTVRTNGSDISLFWCMFPGYVPVWTVVANCANRAGTV